jgi:hypothetical protein
MKVIKYAKVPFAKLLSAKYHGIILF